MKRAGWVGMLVWLIVCSLACDSAGVNEPGGEDLLAPDTLRLSPTAAAMVNNGNVSATSRGGTINSITWHDDAGVEKHAVSTSTIWLAANQDGPKAVTANSSRNPVRSAVWGNDSTGFFNVTPESLEYEIPDWPFSLGAPTDEFDRPAIYGDQMYWGAFVPDGPPGDALEGC